MTRCLQEQEQRHDTIRPLSDDRISSYDGNRRGPNIDFDQHHHAVDDDGASDAGAVASARVIDRNQYPHNGRWEWCRNRQDPDLHTWDRGHSAVWRCDHKQDDRKHDDPLEVISPVRAAGPAELRRHWTIHPMEPIMNATSLCLGLALTAGTALLAGCNVNVPPSTSLTTVT